MVMRGAGGPGAVGNNPGGGTVRIGGQVPWGTEGGVRLPRRVRQAGTGGGYPFGGRAGLFRHAESAGAEKCLV